MSNESTGPPPPEGYPTANPPTSSDTHTNNNASQQQSNDDMRKKWFEDMRGWIMVVAVLVASVTYTTGLNPPGGFWQDNNGDHKAGSAILRDQLPTRYTTFFYANATAFMASLVIIILLMNENFYTNQARVAMLNISMVLDLVSMMIAYAAGCARHLSTSIYVIVLAVGVLFFVIFSSSFLPSVRKFTRNHVPWLQKIAGGLL
jgi:Domain of unknown function